MSAPEIIKGDGASLAIYRDAETCGWAFRLKRMNDNRLYVTLRRIKK